MKITFLEIHLTEVLINNVFTLCTVSKTVCHLSRYQNSGTEPTSWCSCGGNGKLDATAKMADTALS